MGYYYILVGSKNMFEDVSKKTKWSRNSSNSKHGDDIGVGGDKLKLSSIGIELHVESPLPPEWKQCLDLEVCFLLLFFLDYILCFSFIHGFFVVVAIEFTFMFASFF